MQRHERAVVVVQVLANVFALLGLVLPVCKVKLSEKVVRTIYLFDSDNAFDVVRDSDWDTDMKWYSAGIFGAIALAIAVATSSVFNVDFNHEQSKKIGFKSPEVLTLLSVFVSTIAIVILVPDLSHSLFVKSETGDGAETHVASGGYFAMATVVLAPIARAIMVLKQ